MVAAKKIRWLKNKNFKQDNKEKNVKWVVQVTDNGIGENNIGEKNKFNRIGKERNFVL